MRVVIDIDDNSLDNLRDTIYEGFCMLGDYPEVRFGNTKGFHLIWRGLSISEDHMFAFRYFLDDDPNRLRLDLCSKLRIKQVLFSEKVFEDCRNNKIVTGKSLRW